MITRRAFDSVDYFNDYLPQQFRPKPEQGSAHFYRTFGPSFTRQSKFSTLQPVAHTDAREAVAYSSNADPPFIDS